MSEETVLQLDRLGKRFGRQWALRKCSWALPTGRVAALVGPNGAGKTTLLRLATGLIAPSEGVLTVLGQRPGTGGAPSGMSYLAQDKPLYRDLQVAETLRAAAALNTGGYWDAGHVDRLVDEAGLSRRTRIRELSGGQHGRLALALALGRRPRLLLLDEPLTGLDPVARRQAMAVILSEVAETGMSVLLSSHVLAELDEVCDHLVLLRAGTVCLAGDVESLLAEHRLVTGPADTEPPPGVVVHQRRAGRQRTALVRGTATGGLANGVAGEPSLEELVLGYLEGPRPEVSA